MPAVVLFEGESDRLALEAAARVRGTTVDAERVVLGGITNLRAALASPELAGRRVFALYDVAERRYVVGALAAAGLLTSAPAVVRARGDAAGVPGPGGGSGSGVPGPPGGSGSGVPSAAGPDPTFVDDAVLEALGCFGCDRDLEDEVIRAAGADTVLATLEARGELALFRVFQGQPAQRGRPVEAQLHRFAGTAAGRKARFAADVVAALPPDRIPPPLARLLDVLSR